MRANHGESAGTFLAAIHARVGFDDDPESYAVFAVSPVRFVCAVCVCRVCRVRVPCVPCVVVANKVLAG